jgi:excisionase family DNA binding protein
MHKGSANEEFVTTREAAQRLGVALRTVQLWVESGILPAWKTVGGHRRVAKAAVDKLLSERENVISKATTPDKPFRLLLVDDDQKMLKMLGMAIESWQLPITLETAENGFQALVRIGEAPPDFLITDLYMPGMDGFEMIRSLRKSSGDVRNLEILALTGMDPRDIEARGGLPADVRIMHKPVPLRDLQEIVRRRLEAHGTSISATASAKG